MTLAEWFPASIVQVLVVAVLELFEVPVQPLTVFPGDGFAVRVINSPETYVFAPQPVEFAGEATGSSPEPVFERDNV